jgi:RimJ/RimL family protein N-acetyltransferase
MTLLAELIEMDIDAIPVRRKSSIELVPLENTTAHTAALLSLVRQGSRQMSGDYAQDPILAVKRIKEQHNPDNPTHFLVRQDGAFIGYIGAIVDVDGVAYIEGVADKRFRRFYPALSALKQFTRYLFAQDIAQRCESHVPIWNGAAEKVARAAGFRREGMMKSKRLYNGVRSHILLLALLPEYIEG